MHQTPEQQTLRPPLLDTPRPEPGVVGQELRHPALADPIEHQERPLGSAGHQHLAVVDLDVHLAKPASPAGCAVTVLIQRRGDEQAPWSRDGDRRFR